MGLPVHWRGQDIIKEKYQFEIQCDALRDMLIQRDINMGVPVHWRGQEIIRKK